MRCALALLQLVKGASAPRISDVVPLTPQAMREIGHRYREGGLEVGLPADCTPAQDLVAPAG